MKARLLNALIIAVLCLATTPVFGQSLDLSEPALKKLFSGTAMLKDLQIGQFEQSNGQTTAQISHDLTLFNHLGLKVTIKATVNDDALKVTFRDLKPIEASVPLTRRKAKLKMAMDVRLHLDKNYDGIVSLWEYQEPSKKQNAKPVTHTYLAVRINKELKISEFNKVLHALRASKPPLMKQIEQSSIRNPEIIIPIGKKPIPMLFAIVKAEGQAQGQQAKKDVECYFFQMKGAKSFSLLFDFGDISIDLRDLAALAAKEAKDFGKPLEGFKGAIRGKLDSVAVIVTAAEDSLQIRDLDPVMQVPFAGIYAGWRQPWIKYPQGLSVIARMRPSDFPAFNEYFSKLGFASQAMLVGSVGWKKGIAVHGNEDKHLRLRLDAEVSAWDIPLYLSKKKVVNSIVDEADFGFFIDWVPAALEFGIETQFHMNDKFMPDNIVLDGAFEVQLTDAAIGFAVAGKMAGTWRLDHYPAAHFGDTTVDAYRIPVALRDVAGKFLWTVDDTYSFGGRGTTYIGQEDAAKSITLGFKLGLNYDGFDVHPQYFGFMGGINTLQTKDLVDLANVIIAVEDTTRTWTPWKAPDGPLKMHDIYDAKLVRDTLYVATPGAGDAYLGFDTEGVTAGGTLIYNKRELGEVFFKMSKLGVLIYGDLANFHFGKARFDGARVDVAVLADGTPPHFAIYTGVALGQDSLGVDIDLRATEQHARIVLPQSLQELAKTAPGQVVTALDKIGKMGLSSLKFTFDRAVAAQPAPFTIIEQQTLQWGEFALENASIQLLEKAGTLTLAIKGETMLLGNRVAFEGVYDPKQKAFVLRSDIETNPLVGKLVSDAALELKWDLAKASAQAVVKVKHKTVKVQLAANAPPPVPLIENQTLKLGKFAINSVAVQLVDVSGKLGLSMDGATTILDSPVAVEQTIKDGVPLLQSKAKGTFKRLVKGLPYAKVEIYLDATKNKWYARATATATEGNSTADVALEIHEPGKCKGSGDAQIKVKEFAFKGKATLSDDCKTITWEVPSAAKLTAWPAEFAQSVKGGLQSGAVLDDLKDVDFTKIEAPLDFAKLGTNGPALSGAKGVLTKKKSAIHFKVTGKLQIAGKSIAVTGEYAKADSKYVFTADAHGKLKAGKYTLAYSKLSCDYRPSTDRVSCQLTGNIKYGLGSIELEGAFSPAADGDFSMTAKSATVTLLGVKVPMSAGATWVKYQSGAFSASYGFADGTKIQFDQTLPALVVGAGSSVDATKATLKGTLTIDGNAASVSGTADKSSLSLTGTGSGAWKIAKLGISGVSDVEYKKKKGQHGKITFSGMVGGLPGNGSVPFTVTMKGK